MKLSSLIIRVVFLTLCLSTGLGNSLLSQTINHPTSGTSTTTVTCGSTYSYYDSGGAGLSYASSESGVMVFDPSDPSQSVQIDFTTGTFAIEPNGGGCYDYIRVYNGSSTSAPLIGTYCTSNLPGVIKASMNGSLTVSFSSDGSVEHSGWDATVTCESTDPATVSMPLGTNTINACTGTFYDSGGSGSNYTSGQSRTLTINPGSDVTMIFSAFDVEAHASCGYDYLRIHDGPTTGSPVIGTYCGTTSPGTITSTNGSLTFYFYSDASATEPGWTATWSCCSVSGGTISAGTDPICNGNSTTLTLSGHDGGASLQWQSSPDGSAWSNIGGATSSTYSASPSSDTYYRVTVTNGCTVNSTSYLLDVSNSTAGTASASTNSLCSGNSVTMTLAGSNGSIQWQSSTDGSTWSDIGGATSATYSPSPGSDIYYRAKVTDAPCSAVFSNSEFIAVVNCVNISNGSTASCSGILYDDGGSGSNYSASRDYVYTINPGSTVTITFNSFDVEAHATCGYDYLRIYDGPTTGSTLLGTWCNTTGSPGTIVSSGGALTFEWHSDSGTEGAGWDADWSCCSIASGSVTAGTDPICDGNSTTLTLSGHDGGASLQWQSSADGSSWSDIGGQTGTTYSASPSSDTYYRVEVTNGCVVYTTGYLLNVSNSTAGTASASTNTLCSGSSVTMTLAGSSGSIQWQSSTDGSTWSDIGGATSSTYSPSPGSDIYYRAKVTDAPCATVFSNSELITVVNCVNITNGSTALCSGVLYDDGGSSSDYGASSDYVYTINPGNTVTITFNSFDVEAHASCGFDYLRIYDGPTTGATLLGTWCNTTGSPGTIVSSGGSLTFQWHSDSGTEGAGWDAEWSCCAVNAGTGSASPSTMCVAGNTTLSLSGEDGGTTIQWQSSADGLTWSDIGGATTDTEVVAVASSTYYRAKVTNGCDSYSNSTLVSVGGTPIPTNYYVNDNSTTGDLFCTNVGNASNNGRNPCSPKTTLQDIFDTYDIDPGDSIFVDAGTYTMGLDVTVSSDQGDATNDIVIIGAGNTITHITAPAADDNFYFDATRYFMVRDLHMISSQASNYNYYIYEANHHHVENCVLDHSANTNVYMFEEGGTYDIDFNAVADCEINNTSSAGHNVWIRGDGDNDTIRNCVLTSTGTGGAKALLLNDYTVGLHSGWPTSIHFFENNVTADDYGVYGDVVSGNTMELYNIHDNKFTITSSDQVDGSAIWLDDHGLVSSDISNIYNNVISGGKIGICLSSGVDYCHFYNNFICNTEYGFYIGTDDSDDNEYHYNSIYSSKECFYFTADSKAYSDLRNNILYTTGNSSYSCLYAGNTTSTFVRCNYNIYYAPNGAYIATEGASNYTLAGWQGTDHHDGTGNGDGNSVVTDPNFRNVSTCQLDITGNYQTGTTIGGIANDIYGTGRTHPTIGAWEEGSSLPVTSTFANVHCDQGDVIVSWNTVSEINNDYFVIEGTNDGQVYTELDVVFGAGNSTTEQLYEVVFDRSEMIYEFVRITQVDFDGDAKVVNNLSVDCDGQSTFGIEDLYPNPTNGDVTIVINAVGSSDMSIEIIDMEGRVIAVHPYHVEKGLNFIPCSLGAIESGVYMIMVEDENEGRQFKRLVKQ